METNWKKMDAKCKLCKENNLEKVGSHIFTESIIRTAINEDGFTKRVDKELIFEISVNKIGLDFFGAAIQPEKIIEITGKPVTEEQITRNKNELINRNLVCREYEKRFNPIETAFAQDIYFHIAKKGLNELKKDTCNYVSFKDKKVIALLFVIINVWRASASNYDYWKLTKYQEEYLRSFIDQTVLGDLNTIIERTTQFADHIKDFDFILTFFIQDDGPLSDNGIFIDKSISPYFIYLNKLSIIFDFKKICSDTIPEFLKSIIEENIACINSSKLKNELRVGINSEKQRKLLFNRLMKYEFNQIVENFNDTFYELHHKLSGFFPPQSSIAYYKKTMLEYIVERDGKVNIEKMKKLIDKVISDCRRSY